MSILIYDHLGTDVTEIDLSTNTMSTSPKTTRIRMQLISDAIYAAYESTRATCAKGEDNCGYCKDEINQNYFLDDQFLNMTLRGSELDAYSMTHSEKVQTFYERRQTTGTLTLYDTKDHTNCLGFILFKRYPKSHNSVFLDIICGKPGTGRQILESFKEYCRRSGVKTIRLHALLPVIRYYSKFGFRYGKSCGSVLQNAQAEADADAYLQSLKAQEKTFNGPEATRSGFNEIVDSLLANNLLADSNKVKTCKAIFDTAQYEKLFNRKYECFADGFEMILCFPENGFETPAELESINKTLFLKYSNHKFGKSFAKQLRKSFKRSSEERSLSGLRASLSKSWFTKQNKRVQKAFNRVGSSKVPKKRIAVFNKY